jgi:cathepsin B
MAFKIRKFHSCNGGEPSDAFQFFIRKGIVTGGSFESHVGCKPYNLDPDAETPFVTRCYQGCQPYYNKKKYDEDKIYGKDQVTISLNNKEVMQQIKKYGPMVARFKMYEDFLAYADGVYRHVAGAFIGYHYVKIVGWVC